MGFQAVKQNPFDQVVVANGVVSFEFERADFIDLDEDCASFDEDEHRPPSHAERIGTMPADIVAYHDVQAWEEFDVLEDEHFQHLEDLNQAQMRLDEEDSIDAAFNAEYEAMSPEQALVFEFADPDEAAYWAAVDAAEDIAYGEYLRDMAEMNFGHQG